MNETILFIKSLFEISLKYLKGNMANSQFVKENILVCLNICKRKTILLLFYALFLQWSIIMTKSKSKIFSPPAPPPPKKKNPKEKYIQNIHKVRSECICEFKITEVSILTFLLCSWPPPRGSGRKAEKKLCLTSTLFGRLSSPKS